MDGLREGAAVEGVRPVASDQFHAGRQIGILDAVARLHGRRPVHRTPVAEVDPGRLRERRNLLEVLRSVERLVPVGDEAVAREAHGRRDDVRERHGPEALQRECQPSDGTGHRDRTVPVDVGIVLDARPREERVRRDSTDQRVDRGVRGHRCDAVEVETHRLVPLREMHEHRPGAGDRAHEGLDHRHRKRRRHRGVDGVATAREDGGADLRTRRMLGRDEPARGELSGLGQAQARTDHGCLVGAGVSPARGTA